jgi:hypothetical protein
MLIFLSAGSRKGNYGMEMGHFTDVSSRFTGAVSPEVPLLGTPVRPASSYKMENSLLFNVALMLLLC